MDRLVGRELWAERGTKVASEATRVAVELKVAKEALQVAVARPGALVEHLEAGEKEAANQVASEAPLAMTAVAATPSSCWSPR